MFLQVRRKTELTGLGTARVVSAKIDPYGVNQTICYHISGVFQSALKVFEGNFKVFV